MSKINKIKKIIKREHQGSAGIEGTLLTPLLFLTFLFLLYFFFIGLSFILYGNISNSVAQELNMRQSGYTTAIGKYGSSNFSSIKTKVESKQYDLNGNIENSSINYISNFSDDKIIVSPNSKELRAGTYFALNKYKDQFVLPFTGIDSVKVQAAKKVDVNDKNKMSGNVIKVTITYYIYVFGHKYSINSSGYNVIS